MIFCVLARVFRTLLFAYDLLLEVARVLRVCSWMDAIFLKVLILYLSI